MTPRQAAEIRRTALAVSKRLWAAHEAMGKFRLACTDAGVGPLAMDDTRITLPEKMAEYAKYLDAAHGGGQ